MVFSKISVTFIAFFFFFLVWWETGAPPLLNWKSCLYFTFNKSFASLVVGTLASNLITDKESRKNLFTGCQKFRNAKQMRKRGPFQRSKSNYFPIIMRKSFGCDWIFIFFFKFPTSVSIMMKECELISRKNVNLVGALVYFSLVSILVFETLYGKPNYKSPLLISKYFILHFRKYFTSTVGILASLIPSTLLEHPPTTLRNHNKNK